MQPRPRRWSLSQSDLWRWTTSLLLVAGLWQLGALVAATPVIQGPLPTLGALFELLGTSTYYQHLLTSLATVLSGFGVSVLFGVTLALLAFTLPVVNRVIVPITDAVRPISGLAIFPVLIVLLGIGWESKTVMIFWTAWPAIFVNALHGLNSTPVEVSEAASLDGADIVTKVSHIHAPLAIPSLAAGFNVAVSGAWVSVIAAEMLGGTRGLGYTVFVSSQTFQYPKMYAAIVTIALCGLAMAAVATKFQRYSKEKWQ